MEEAGFYKTWKLIDQAARHDILEDGNANVRCRESAGTHKEGAFVWLKSCSTYLTFCPLYVVELFLIVCRFDVHAITARETNYAFVCFEETLCSTGLVIEDVHH
jgi:hypothetical protein